MLGRSAREKPSCDCGCEAALANSRRYAKNKHRRCRLRPAKTTNSWPLRRHPSEHPSTCCGSPQQAQGAIARRNAAENAEQWLLRLTLRRSSALLSRAGRSLGRRRPANIRLSPGVPLRLRPNPRQTYFVILSEAKNLFPCEPKAACELCLARRRKTNEVQSRICLRILLYRFFVALLLRMTNY